SQTRSAITDGAYGKPWIFRYKDLKSWWLNPHYDRPGGVEAVAATGWVPQSKPFWFTEAGSPAIDKGTNQPNAFVDAKSAESLVPYFSSGERDDLTQNRYVTALNTYWSAAGAHNPVSSLYGSAMVDAGRILFWAWDARPFPFFPARADLWSDAVNYARGHWLNGRIGAVPLARLIEAVCAQYGFADLDVSEVEGLVDGYLIDRPMSARDALEGVLAAFAIDAVERNGLIAFHMRQSDPVLSVGVDGFVETDAAQPLFALTRAQETELPAVVRLAYVESGLDYRSAIVEARHLQGESAREISVELPCAVGQPIAQMRAEVALQESWAARDGIELALPPTRIELEPGDVVTLQLASGARNFRVDHVSDGEYRKLRLRSYQTSVFEVPAAPSRAAIAFTVFNYGTPDAFFLDLPIAGANGVAHAPWIAAGARPWPGQLALFKAVGSGYILNRSLEAEATKGQLLEALPAGPLYLFDRKNSFTVKLDHGALSAVSETEILQGLNVAAVGSSTTGWEIIQFAGAELVGTDTYRLSTLLRGQSGSEPEMLASRPAGSCFVLLNGAVVQPVLSLADAGLPQIWRIGPSQYDIALNYLSLATPGKLLGLRPLAPCQPRSRRDGADTVFNWIRRTREGGDSWELAEVPLAEDAESYVLEILDGVSVKRSVTLAVPSYRYLASEIAADFGTPPSAFTLRIAQSSTAFGRGAPLVETVRV
ncbi:MAG: baseplate megatron protein TIM-barrel domain-containing protein, partial [Aestuariivirga sp.]